MSNDSDITSDTTEEGMEYRKWTRSNHKFKPGMCSRCQKTDLTIDTDIGIIKCNYCNDWAWLDDAINSCWNSYVNKENKIMIEYPSDDHIWKLAQEDRPITREELGINTPRTYDGLQTLSEGFDLFPKKKSKKKKRSKNNIVEFESNLEHEVAELICLKCFKRYIGVYPVSTFLKDLQCSCGETGYIIKTGQTILNEEDYIP